MFWFWKRVELTHLGWCVNPFKTGQALAFRPGQRDPQGSMPRASCHDSAVCRGISLALKALTLFFIGGASGCARLLSCQDTDGGAGNI